MILKDFYLSSNQDKNLNFIYEQKQICFEDYETDTFTENFRLPGANNLKIDKTRLEIETSQQDKISYVLK